MTQKWLTAKQVGDRYGTSEKWPWYMQKQDNTFPRGTRFSNGMTRWNIDELNAYDALKSEALA